MSLPTLLVLLAATSIIVALASYAIYLWYRVWQQQKLSKNAEKQHRKRLAGELHILADSLLNGQLPLIEGAIRIKVLLDNYDPILSQCAQSKVFQQIYNATAHIPTHEAWRALSKAQRQAHEQEFELIRNQHEQSAHAAARWLLEQIQQ